MDYFVDFIVTYIESNTDKIFNNQMITNVAAKVIDNIIKGLGTYLLK